MHPILQAKSDYLQANPDGDFVAWANETITTGWREYWFRYNTLAAAFGTPTADGVADFLKATSPNQYTIFLTAGFDVGAEVTRENLDAAAEAAPQFAPIVQWLKAQSVVQATRIPGVSDETIAAAELSDMREEKQAAFASLWNEVVMPNLATAIPPSEAELKTLLKIA